MLFRKKKTEDFEVEICEIIEEIVEEEEDVCLSEVEDAPAEDVELRAEGYVMTEDTFLSNDGDTDVAYYIFTPKNLRPKAIIQLSHGMCEYVLRYTGLAEALCEKGYIFCGNDHLGHGYTAECEDDLGFTAAGGGAAYLVKDVHKLTRIMKNKYPDLPVVLIGHSMGSFIARLYIEHYADEIAAAVIVGTGGPEAPAALGKKLAKIIMVEKGERSRSALLDKLAFGSYNKKFKKETTPHAWLTRDEQVREIYDTDEFCNYKFTARGFYDLFDMLDAVSRKEWAKKIDKDLPILLMSGEMDPVGNYGKGVKKVYNRLKHAGVKDVTVRLYTEGRHELFNEINKEVVIRNTIEWIEDKLEERY
jgi:alpha-beta hydrolase superfamily lysophospholipase